MIPRQLHQTWSSAALPPTLRREQASWQRWHPAWPLHFYDDRACAAFVEGHYPALAAPYHQFRFAIQRADFFRYLVVYHYGGLYTDLDMRCYRAVDPWLTTADALFCVEAHLTAQRQQELGYQHPYQIANCIFAAAPNHWFLWQVIEAAAEQAARPIHCEDDIEESTGPRLLTRLYFALAPAKRQALTLLPQIYWMAPTLYPNCWPLNMNMYASHRCLGSWKARSPTRPSLRRRWVERSRLPNPWPKFTP